MRSPGRGALPAAGLLLFGLCAGCATRRSGSEVDQDELVDTLRGGGGEPWPEVSESEAEPEAAWEVRVGEPPSDPYAFRSARGAGEGSPMGVAVVGARKREAPARSGDGPSLTVEGYELVPGHCGSRPAARYGLEWRSDERELMDEVLRPRGPEPMPPGWGPEQPPVQEAPPEVAPPPAQGRLIPVGSAR